MPFKRLGLLTNDQSRGLRDYFRHGIDESPTYQAGNEYLQGILSGDPAATRAFEQPYLTQFQQQIVPGLAERFAGAGTGAGAASSSAFNQTLAQAGSTLQQQLAQLRSGLQMQASGQALQYAQQPFSNTLGGLGVRGFENVYQPSQPSPWSGILSGIGGGIATGAGMAIGGPGGAMAANGLFNGLKGLFSGGGGGGPSAGGYNQEFRQQGLGPWTPGF